MLTLSGQFTINDMTLAISSPIKGFNPSYTDLDLFLSFLNLTIEKLVSTRPGFTCETLILYLFKSMPKEAIWYNERNIAQHKNLGDAFLLRLFKGIIVKVANADDIRVSELYSKSRKEGIMASFKVEQDLMEWEANLWEY